MIEAKRLSKDLWKQDFEREITPVDKGIWLATTSPFFILILELRLE